MRPSGWLRSSNRVPSSLNLLTMIRTSVSTNPTVAFVCSQWRCAFLSHTLSLLLPSLIPVFACRPGSRTLSHEALQDHLDARYHISPSLLYSIVRPGRGTEMEVPVEADYVVIGVLAEKSGIKMTAPKSTSSAPAAAAGKDKKGKGKAVDDGFPADAKLDDALDGNTVDEQIDEDDPDNPAGQERQQQKKKRFVIFKLLDMRLKRDGLSSAGDSMLSLIMFESDSSRALYEADSDEELVDAHTGARMRKEDKKSGKRTDQRVYKGGSGGAYEKFWKEQNGTVVAILNPKVLKPRPVSPFCLLGCGRTDLNFLNPQQSGQWANTSNILTITPDSAESIVVIGRSKDLGTCAALRRDGQPCRAWCDKFVSFSQNFRSHPVIAIPRLKVGWAQEGQRRVRLSRSERTAEDALWQIRVDDWVRSKQTFLVVVDDARLILVSPSIQHLSPHERHRRNGDEEERRADGARWPTSALRPSQQDRLAAPRRQTSSGRCLHICGQRIWQQQCRHAKEGWAWRCCQRIRLSTTRLSHAFRAQRERRFARAQKAKRV